MKKLIPILCLIFIFSACKKSKPVLPASQGADQGTTTVAVQDTFTHSGPGIIVGYDYRACWLCGGVLVKILNDTAKNPRPYYNIRGSLSDLGIREDAKLPVNVSLTYKLDTGFYDIGYITVSKITVN